MRVPCALADRRRPRSRACCRWVPFTISAETFMLRSAKDIEDCTIGATDGAIGKVEDCYFDDEAWVIRYLVVDTGEWLSSRKVLISRSANRTGLKKRCLCRSRKRASRTVPASTPINRYRGSMKGVTSPITAIPTTGAATAHWEETRMPARYIPVPMQVMNTCRPRTREPMQRLTGGNTRMTIRICAARTR